MWLYLQLKIKQKNLNMSLFSSYGETEPSKRLQLLKTTWLQYKYTLPKNYSIEGKDI